MVSEALKRVSRRLLVTKPGIGRAVKVTITEPEPVR